MRKKLIAAIVVALILLILTVCAAIYLENKSAEIPEQTSPEETSAVDATVEITEAPAEPTEETVGMTFPTENPDDVTPEDTFTDENIVPPVTDYSGTGETEDPDANETPEDEF